jgi:hypothetical protein
MVRPQPSKQTRNKTQTRKDWAKVEQYLSAVERAHGHARSWEMRERLEAGDTTLKEILRR